MTPAIVIVLALSVSAGPPIVALAITPDGQQALAASQAGIAIHSLPDLKQTRTLPTQLEHIHDLAFSPRGNLLAAAGGSPAERGAVELWEWPTAKLQTTIALGEDVAYDLAWNADGTQLAVAGADKSVRLIDVGTEGNGTRSVPATWRPHSAAVLAVAWLPEGNFVLSAGVDRAIRVLQPASGETIRSLDNHTAAVRDLAIRPGKHPGPAVVASAGADRTIRFWQPTIGRLVRFARLPSAPTTIAWTPSGTHLLAACEDGLVRAIDYETLTVTELASQLDGCVHALAILPGGAAALVAGDKAQLRSVPLDAINP